MFTALVRPWFKNVARLSSLMFSSVDALKIGKRNSIQRAPNDYLTECYPFSVKRSNVSSRSISPSRVILSFITFRCFHRISDLVTSSGPFQLWPTAHGSIYKTAFFSKSRFGLF